MGRPAPAAERVVVFRARLAQLVRLVQELQRERSAPPAPVPAGRPGDDVVDGDLLQQAHERERALQQALAADVSRHQLEQAALQARIEDLEAENARLAGAASASVAGDKDNHADADDDDADDGDAAELATQWVVGLLQRHAAEADAQHQALLAAVQALKPELARVLEADAACAAELDAAQREVRDCRRLAAAAERATRAAEQRASRMFVELATLRGAQAARERGFESDSSGDYG